MIRSRMIALLALGAAAWSLSGCAAVVAFAGVKAGTMVAQDRSMGAAFDDATINTQYNTRLAAQSITLARHVNVKVMDGRILLTGHVPTYEDRDLAGRIAADVPGVREVANELEVADGKSMGSYLGDLRISNELRGKLLTDRKINWVNYNVQTVDGTIYLMGTAKNQAELAQVTEKARTISGVKKVVSYVEIKGGATQQQASLN
ncbi:MAG: BON domain-containing protein [Alphaproteobacteria bacterium]